jgi:hypothetical protein
MTDERSLVAEAAALHRALFDRELPEEIGRHYAAAHPHALTKVTEAERHWMARALQARSDLEALEVAVRLLRPDHILTRKMKLLVYLAEASPDCYDRFVNEEPCRAGACVALVWHGMRTLFKFLKGCFILEARRL